MNNISLTVPMEYHALHRASIMLSSLAEDINTVMLSNLNDDDHRNDGQNNEGDLVDNSGSAATIEQVTQAEVDAGNLPAGPTTAASAFGDEAVDKSTGEMLGNDQNAGTATGQDTAQLAPVTEKIVNTAIQSDVAQNVTAPVGVELDDDGLPWDSRINPASKLKLKKAPHTWKRKRGLDDEFVKTVQAELRQAMAAGGAENPSESVATTADANTTQQVQDPAAQTTIAQDAAPLANVPAGPAGPSGPAGPDAQTEAVTTMSLPELIAKCTAAGVAQDTLVAAANRQGLASFALLGARPDLIPKVAAELFPEG